MPDEQDQQRADAVMIKVGTVVGASIFQRMADVHSRFAAVIGVTKCFFFPAASGQTHSFYAPRVTDSIYFPADHKLAGQDRYEWTEDADGIKYGTLVPAAKAELQPTV
jgi:hypothetical protein